MRKWFLAGAVFLFLLIGAYLALSYYGVRIIVAQLQRVTGPGLTIDRMKVRPTFLALLGIRYEDPSTKQVLLQVEEVRIYPDVFSLLKGGLWVRDVVIRNPAFSIYRTTEGRFIGPWIGAEGLGREVQAPQAHEEKGRGTITANRRSREGEKPTEKPRDERSGRPGFLRAEIARFRMENGAIDFEDRKGGSGAARLQLRGIGLEVRDLRYPLVSKRSELQFHASLKGKRKDGWIEAKGWVDFSTFDMEVPVKMREVELKTFEPYYRKRVTAEIVAGTIDLDFKLSLQGGKIDTPGEVRVANLQLGKGEGMVFYLPAKLLIPLLQSKGNEVRARFRVKGDLRDPRFDLEESFLVRMGLSLAESLGLPIKGLGEQLVGGSVKGAEGLVEGIRAIGEVFKKKK